MKTSQDIDRVVAYLLKEKGERLPECTVCEAPHLDAIDAVRCCQPHLSRGDALELLALTGRLDEFEENITRSERLRIAARLEGAA